MNTKDHEKSIRELLANYCLLSTEILFVDNVRDWCKSRGIEESDKNKPLRFIIENEKACDFVIREFMQEEIVRERINALSVRSALFNVAHNKADMLDSEKKKLAYLILSEYAATIQTPEDEMLADQWVFDELERHGYFRE